MSFSKLVKTQICSCFIVFHKCVPRLWKFKELDFLTIFDLNQLFFLAYSQLVFLSFELSWLEKFEFLFAILSLTKSFHLFTLLKISMNCLDDRQDFFIWLKSQIWIWNYRILLHQWFHIWWSRLVSLSMSLWLINLCLIWLLSLFIDIILFYLIFSLWGLFPLSLC